MVRSPRATLAAAIARPRSVDLAILIVLVAASGSVAFLMTPVGRLAALDQQARQLESIGASLTDARYAELRDWERYRPLLSGLGILVGWPVMWACGAAATRAIGNRAGHPRATFAQVFTVIVHASSVLALRALLAAPVNYLRESLGGATSLGVLLPLGDSTFAARVFASLDLFVLWWVLLLAIGLGMLYHTRASSIARWLVGAYATAAAALAFTQALRGGI